MTVCSSQCLRKVVENDCPRAITGCRRHSAMVSAEARSPSRAATRQRTTAVRVEEDNEEITGRNPFRPFCAGPHTVVRRSASHRHDAERRATFHLHGGGGLVYIIAPPIGPS